MKIAIIGVGAIGGYVGIRLALAGEDVTFIARGANLEALRTQGIRMVNADGTEEAVPRVKATDNYAQAGPQDIVVLAMKAHQVEAVTGEVPKLFGPKTIVIPMQNGIPYWYFHGHQGEFAGARVQCVDPSGAIYENIPCERVIGCVVYPAAELLAPGVGHGIHRSLGCRPYSREVLPSNSSAACVRGYLSSATLARSRQSW
jgi:2-dehydropantoate 2-reductase